MEDKFLEKREDAIAPHIFSVSATMMGVCLTVIGIINVISTYKKITTIADDLTVVAAFIFLCSCSASYFSMRIKDVKRRYLFERISDAIFMTGLVVVVVICFFIVMTLEKSAGIK